MIEVYVYSGSDGRKRGITVSGHAGYGEEGYDIVCAAVSALTITMANAVEAFTEDRFEAGDGDGFFTFTFTGDHGKESELLLDALVLGLKDIERSYGERYIRISYREV